MHTTVLSHNDNAIILLLRNNLIRICINECVKVFAIVDTGAVTTVMSLQTLHLLRKEGQKCKLYKAENIELTAININRLKHHRSNLCTSKNRPTSNYAHAYTRVYVITNTHVITNTQH